MISGSSASHKDSNKLSILLSAFGGKSFEIGTAFFVLAPFLLMSLVQKYGTQYTL